MTASGRRRAALCWCAAALALLAVDASAQCAMCVQALTQSDQGQAMSGDFNKAILVLLAAPYAIFGGIVAVFFRKHVRAQAARLAAHLPERLRVRWQPTAR